MSPVVLEIVSALMFLLFAVTALLGIRTFGGAKAALLFASANVLHALAVVAFIAGQSHPRWTIVSTFLLIAGFAALHRSFAEQLDRPHMLWWLQVSIVVLTCVGLAVSSRAHFGLQAVVLISSVVAAVQLALTASVVSSFTGDVSLLAGRFVGGSLLAYAVAHLLRAEAGLRFGSPLYAQEVARTSMLCVAVAMLSGAATAFGFGFIASSKQRIELLWRAQIDELTGLLNRWAFKRIAVKETFRSMRRFGSLSVVMMDLDGMKRVNDRLGHGCGDAVLQAVAGALQAAVRERDSIARMGGDEFCILLPDTDLEQSVLVAERLRSEIDALRIRYRGEIVQVRASFGVSCSAQCGWNWQTLMDRSDAALYDAKRAGNLRVMVAALPVDEPESLSATPITTPEPPPAAVAERDCYVSGDYDLRGLEGAERATCAEERGELVAALCRQHACRQHDLVIELRVVEYGQNRAAGAGFGIVCGIDEFAEAGVQDGSSAHRARLQSADQGAAGEAVVAKLFAGSAERDDLRVGCRIGIPQNAIAAGGEDRLLIGRQ